VRFAVIAVLLAFLAGAIFVGHYGWVSAGNVTMPAWGWLMMGLGIFFTLAIGGGLMVLIFYSSRAGYDEAPQIEYDDETEDGSESQSTARSRTVLTAFLSECQTFGKAAAGPAAPEAEAFAVDVAETVAAELRQRPVLRPVHARRDRQPRADAVHQLVRRQHDFAAVHALVDDPRRIARRRARRHRGKSGRREQQFH